MHRMRTATVGVLLAVATGAALTACSAGNDPTALPTASVTSPPPPSSPAGPSGAPVTTAPSSAPVIPSSAPGTGATITPKPRVPSGFPKTPSDPKRAAGMIDGVITRGGDGPCFGLVTFDGVEYAVYAEDAPTLGKGVQIEAKVTPSRLRIDCGSGTQVQATSVKVLG